MSLLDSIFGSGTQAGLLGSNTTQTSQLANQAFNQAYNNYQAQMGQQSLSNQFNQKMMNWNQNPFAKTSNWVFAGKPCTLEEFADAIWGSEPHEDKMLFLLTHSGPDK